MKLGVNIDHIATLRQARGENDPEPLFGVALARLGGADGITVHLREDRRHICDRDVELLRRLMTSGEMNLEMAATKEMVTIAREVKPDLVTLVPENRQELTTEGGLDVRRKTRSLRNAVQAIADSGIPVSLFINPDTVDVEYAEKTGAHAVEIHTGPYANARTETERDREHQRVVSAVRTALDMGLMVNAGHGLNYDNVTAVARIPGLRGLYIGHGIIARAVFVGLERAVREMRILIDQSAGGGSDPAHGAFYRH